MARSQRPRGYCITTRRIPAHRDHRDGIVQRAVAQSSSRSLAGKPITARSHGSCNRKYGHLHPSDFTRSSPFAAERPACSRPSFPPAGRRESCPRPLAGRCAARDRVAVWGRLPVVPCHVHDPGDARFGPPMHALAQEHVGPTSANVGCPATARLINRAAPPRSPVVSAFGSWLRRVPIAAQQQRFRLGHDRRDHCEI